MPPNTSATGGYLTPTTPPPADDLDLDKQIQALVIGITGLPAGMVRPRFQMLDGPEKATPRTPNVNEDWCAIGVMGSVPDAHPAIRHDGAGEGSSTLTRHETLDVLASFYGPASNGYATLLRDGLYVAQNREALTRQGMGVIDTDPIRRLPQVINTMPRRRSDLAFRLRRRVDRTFAILNLEQAVGTIVAETARDDGATAIVHQPFKAPEN